MEMAARLARRALGTTAENPPVGCVIVKENKVLGVGWTVQAAALPPPERAELVVARAALWLSRYRFVVSAFAVGGSPAIHAQCLEGWFSTGRSGSGRGTALHFGRSATIVSLQGRTLEVLGVEGVDGIDQPGLNEDGQQLLGQCFDERLRVISGLMAFNRVAFAFFHSSNNAVMESLNAVNSGWPNIAALTSLTGSFNWL